MTSPLLAAALDYATRGWPVLPLRPRAKVPATRNGLHDATLEVDQITAWWRRWPDANVGLATGAAFDVLDLDGDQALEELDNAAPPDAGTIVGPIVATGNGVHIYVAPTGAGNRAGFLPGVDWRGAGGYVVAPPSIHPRGASYEWGDGYGPDHSIAPCPPWLAALVRGDVIALPVTRPTCAAPGPARTRWARVALDAEVGKVATAAPGTRNHTLNAAAFSLGQIVAAGHLDPADVAARLLTAATRAGLEEREAVPTIASGLRSGARTPRSAS